MPAEVDEMVRDLNEQYARNACPYTIESRGAGYRTDAAARVCGRARRLAGRVRQARLSQAAIEVLALVAYNGSISGDEIAKIRGRPSGAILSQLVRRQLLKVERTDGETAPAPAIRPPADSCSCSGWKASADLPRSQEVEER